MTKLRHVSQSRNISEYMRHLGFFINSYYKWMNERLLGLAHVYLFIFWTLLLIFDISSFEKISSSILTVTLITF